MGSERRFPSSHATGLLLGALCLLGVLVYLPGLSTGFIFDDNFNIVNNDHLHVHNLSTQSLTAATFSGTSGPLKRPVSMLTFALNYYFAGLDPFYFELTNLVIHLLNGIGLFLLTRLILGVYRERFESRLTDRQILWVSIAASSTWILHPLNLTSVLYIVQRMTSLSALFVIWGLVLYMAGRRRLDRGSHGMAMIVAAVAVFTPLAVLSKENGALLPVFMLVLEATLFGFQTVQKRQRLGLYAVFGITVALPILAIVAYSLIHPQWFLAGYRIRDFTLSERLLTESRVLWFYIKEILIPSNAQLGLFHDDMPISHGLLSPPVTLFAVLGLVLLMTVAIYSRRRAPLVSLGLLWFFVGQSIESTVVPLELAFEHRNYVPDYGILLFTTYYLLYPFTLKQFLNARRALTAAFAVTLAVGTAVRADDWGIPALHAVTTVEHHPNSPRANNFAGRIYIDLASAAKDPKIKKRYELKALSYFEASARLAGNDPDGMFDTLITRNVLHRPLGNHLVADLEDRLEHQPFATNSANQLAGLVRCERNNICHIPSAIVKGLYQAALANHTLKGRTRVAVLTSMADHLANIDRDFQSGLTCLRQAITIKPNDVVSHLNYVRLLTAAGDKDQARRQLQILKALDTWGLYAREIAAQEQMLAQAKEPSAATNDLKSDTSSTQIDSSNHRNSHTGA